MNLTPEQTAHLATIRRKWEDRMTVQATEEAIRAAAASMWRRRDLPAPRVDIVDSPKAVRAAAPAGYTIYSALWWPAWAEWYESARYLGATFDEPLLEDLFAWCQTLPFFAFSDEHMIVSRFPLEVHYDATDRPHNEGGPAVRWADGFAIWSIEGVDLNEQIVMRPETQTIRQIADEQNEEVRRIRIERFGWLRYLEESGSVVLEAGRNDIEATYEILADTPLGQRLITHCPSTGRRYSLAVPGQPVKTREEAQNRIWGDVPKVYVVGRT